MSDEPKKRSWKWIAWTALALIALYPLSVGPVLLLAGKWGGLPNRTRLDAGTWIAVWAGASAATVASGLKVDRCHPGRVRWVPHRVERPAILAPAPLNSRAKSEKP